MLICPLKQIADPKTAAAKEPMRRSRDAAHLLVLIRIRIDPRLQQDMLGLIIGADGIPRIAAVLAQ